MTWKDGGKEDERGEVGPPGGKTNLDIHRSGEQSPPGETMPVINKGWQSELSINTVCMAWANLLCKQLVSLYECSMIMWFQMFLWDVSFAGCITIYIWESRWMSEEGKLADITIICTRCWIPSHHHQPSFRTKIKTFRSLLIWCINPRRTLEEEVKLDLQRSLDQIFYVNFT